MISSLDLARICGVSQATVDRAMHGREGIAARTRQRILREAAKHGYRANPIASELLRGDSRIVGAIVPMFGRVFFADMMSELAVAVAWAGLRLFLSPAEDEAGFFDAAAEFASRRVRAIVVIPPRPGLTLDAATTGGVRVLSLLDACGDEAALVAPDERQTGRDAVQYLTQRGHRRIVHVTYARQGHALTDREAGYVEAIQARGLTPVVLREPDDATLVQCGATAMFCHNDWLAVRVIGALTQAGFAVPGDVSVLGVDDSPTLRQVWPTLTTMRYPMAGVAARVTAIIAGVETASMLPIEPLTIVERATVADAVTA
jgi:DNA-binding LacI/PurR family transcriptional regulator